MTTMMSIWSQLGYADNKFENKPVIPIRHFIHKRDGQNLISWLDYKLTILVYNFEHHNKRFLVLEIYNMKLF
jgi:hypothetical protein